MKKILISLFLITAVLITACDPKYEMVNGCEIRPKTQCSKFDLREADLREADLREADLRGTDLKGADLHYAKLGSVNFRGAAYNKSTKFPDGFNPEKVGVVLVE